MSRLALLFLLTAGMVAAEASAASRLRVPTLELKPVPGATQVVRGDDARSVVWLEGELGHIAQPRPEELWRVLDALGPQLGLRSPRTELALDTLQHDALGMLHARFRRVHLGLPVVESDLVLHFDARGTLVVVNGRYPASLRLSPLNVSLDRGVLIQRAIEAARLSARRRGELTPISPRRTPKTREVIWPDPPRHALEVLVDFDLHQRFLVYVDLLRATPLAVRNLVHTDSATTGSGLDSNGDLRSLNITHFTEQDAYGLLDTTSGTGGRIGTTNANYQQTLQAGLFSSASTTSGWDPAAVDVHANMRIVYDYFKSQHGRSSWDGNGADIVSVVHFGSGYANAFWNGEVMGFGDGDGQTLVKPHACLDVAGHELSHAVIDGTVGLVYENQSGALNEHFADVFGVLIDGDDWNVGEGCAGPALGQTALRSMSDPHAGNQPAHMDEYMELPNTEDGDNGGVHINSGIPNHAAYLVGTRLDRLTLGRIWYRSLAQGYLNERSQFLDLRRAALRACSELYPAATCTTVGDAFDDVGLLGASSGGGECPVNSHEESGGCVCDDGYKPNAAGSACELIADANCPPNSVQQGEDCYCVEGYEVNAEGTGCVVANLACPPHSSRVGGQCVCDDGYQGSPSSDYGCQPVTDACPPNSRPVPEGCACVEGWVPNAEGSACEPGTSGCGDETYFGRCDGDTLVYCNGDKIELVACGTGGLVCRLRSAEVGNDCMEPPVSGCGDLDYRGECVGTVARWCDKDSVKQVDCGAKGCLWISEQVGYTCNPCPDNATYREGEQGAKCYCDTNYEPSPDATKCIPTFNETPDAGTDPSPVDAGTDDETPDGGTTSSSNGSRGGGGSRTRGPGCGCGGGGDAGLLLLAPALLLMTRRRRGWLTACLLSVACATPAQPPPVVKAPPVVSDEKRPALPKDALTLQEGDSWQSEDGSLELVVRKVIDHESPCPPGAKCVWTGIVRQVVLDLTLDGETTALRLNEREVHLAAPWRIEVLRVDGSEVSMTARKVVLKPS